MVLARVCQFSMWVNSVGIMECQHRKSWSICGQWINKISLNYMIFAIATYKLKVIDSNNDCQASYSIMRESVWKWPEYTMLWFSNNDGLKFNATTRSLWNMASLLFKVHDLLMVDFPTNPLLLEYKIEVRMSCIIQDD